MKVSILVLAVLAMVSRLFGADPTLVGKWYFAHPPVGEWKISSVGVTIYNADGTFYSGGVMTIEHPDFARSIPSTMSGTWKIDGSRLTMTLKESSAPKALPPGTVVESEIIEINDSIYRFRMPDGSESKEIRIKE